MKKKVKGYAKNRIAFSFYQPLKSLSSTYKFSALMM